MGLVLDSLQEPLAKEGYQETLRRSALRRKVDRASQGGLGPKI